MQCCVKVLGLLQLVRVLTQRLRHGGVEHNVAAGNGVGGAKHTELELIAGERKGRRPVPVGSITQELGQHMGSQLHHGLFRAAVRLILLDGIQNGRQLVTQKDGHHSGRCLVGAQTVIIAGGGHRDTQQVLIVIHCLNNGTQEQQELGVFVGCLTGSQQVHTGIRGHRPVVVLAGAVDTVKGLFMQQTDQPVAGSHLLHDLHGQLVVIGGDICGGVDGRQLMLGRGHLIVLRLGQNTQLPELLIQIGHILRHTGLDSAEVMVIHLLTLGGSGTEQRAAAENQVLALAVHGAVHQEILLLGADRGANTFDIRVAKQLQDTHGLLVQGLHGAQQRGFFIQRLATVGTERRGDTQCLVLDKSVRGRIPGGVAPGLEGSTQAAGGEAGGIRLTLDQLFTRELHDDAAIRRGGNKAVVLLGGNAGQRLEPMGKVGRAVLDGPILHGIRHHIRYLVVQASALVNGLLQGNIDVMGKACFHLSVVKYQCAENVRYGFHVFHPDLL